MNFQTLATVIIVGVLVHVAILVQIGRNPFLIFSYGIIGILAGISVANLVSIRNLLFSISGKGGQFQAQFQQVEQKAIEVERISNELHALEGRVQKSESSVTEMRNAVQSDVNEIKQLKEQMMALANGVQQSQQNIEQTGQNVLQIQTDTKRALRAFTESFYLEASTRNIFPFPKTILDQLNARLHTLEEFSYNSPAERAAAFQELKRMVDEVQPHIPTRTPPATPVP